MGLTGLTAYVGLLKVGKLKENVDEDNTVFNRTWPAQDSPADMRARQIEEQMTDDERFSLIVIYYY